MAKQSACSCSKVEKVWKKVCAKSKGAEFKKVDLHIHTPGSDDATGRNRYNFKYKRDEEGSDEKVKEIARKIVENATKQNLAVIAITDHNSPSYVDHHNVGSRTWYSEIRNAVKEMKKDLVVLPGCEISSDDAHILAIFPPEKEEPKKSEEEKPKEEKPVEEKKPKYFAESAYKVAFVLDACNFKIEDYGILARTGSKSIVETVRLILQRGGLGIPAHIDGGNKAMLEHYKKSGAIYENIVNEPGLNSFEIVRTNLGGKWIAKTKGSITKEEIRIYLNSGVKLTKEEKKILRKAKGRLTDEEKEILVKILTKAKGKLSKKEIKILAKAKGKLTKEEKEIFAKILTKAKGRLTKKEKEILRKAKGRLTKKERKIFAKILIKANDKLTKEEIKIFAKILIKAKNEIRGEEIKIYLNSLRLKTKRHPFPKYPLLSFIQNSDSHCLKDIGKRFFYAKMEEPSFRSLQNVLEDPETRVKSMDFKQSYSGKTLIEGMCIGECHLRFNENLNVIIGKSGSFKSTILKLLIFGLGRIEGEEKKTKKKKQPKREEIEKKEIENFSYIKKKDYKVWVFVRKDLEREPLYCFFRQSGMEEPCLFEKKGSKWKHADLAKTKLALPRLYNKELADETFKDSNEFKKFLHKMGISKKKKKIPKKVEQQFIKKDKLQQLLLKKEFPFEITWKGEKPTIGLLKDKKYIEFSRLDRSHKEIVKILTLLFFSKDFGLLVIDEPEINLDEKDIAHYLVPVLRSLKAKNQILLTTKSADLVVSADAENVIVMASHKKIKVESGDFLKENIRQQVIELLEGGEKALLKRSIKIDLNLKEPPFAKY